MEIYHYLSGSVKNNRMYVMYAGRWPIYKDQIHWWLQPTLLLETWQWGWTIGPCSELFSGLPASVVWSVSWPGRLARRARRSWREDPWRIGEEGVWVSISPLVCGSFFLGSLNKIANSMLRFHGQTISVWDFIALLYKHPRQHNKAKASLYKARASSLDWFPVVSYNIIFIAN